MEVFRRDPEFLESDRPTVLTIGKFDGIHRGHRQVLETVAARAHANDWQSAVIILWPPPPEVLRPGAQIPRLSTLTERELAIAASGIDLLILWPFTLELSRLTPRDFMRLLRRRLDLRLLVIGSDFALGHQRSGTPDVLRDLGKELGFGVEVSPPYVHEGQAVSSSRIRGHLSAGDVAQAARLLGRWPTLTGTIVRGAGRGKDLGFPTANLHLEEPLAVPAHGIYASFATLAPGWRIRSLPVGHQHRRAPHVRRRKCANHRDIPARLRRRPLRPDPPPAPGGKTPRRAEVYFRRGPDRADGAGRHPCSRRPRPTPAAGTILALTCSAIPGSAGLKPVPSWCGVGPVIDP